MQKLDREPGKRESRYIHLLSEIDETSLSQIASAQPSTSIANKTQNDIPPVENQSSLAQRVTELEEKVALLTEQLSRLFEG